jgi:hypothetical protein
VYNKKLSIHIISALGSAYINDVLTGKFDLTNVNNMAFYISGPKLLFETIEISTHPKSNYIYCMFLQSS